MAKHEIAKAYNHHEVEDKWYEYWMKNGYFYAKVNPEKKPYTIVMPPPNITGVLTLGHVLNNTIQDIYIRWKRMQGYEACWIPGTDHAGIATQNVVEKALAKEGLRREDLGREKFLERVWKWKEEYGSTIIKQLKKLGVSCDWKRERFTMDEGLSNAVKEVFIRLYEKGLIYRGKYIVMAIDPDSPNFSMPKIEQFKISGIYETGMAEYDDIFVYVHLKHAQYLFDLGNRVSGFDVMVKNVDFIDETALLIQDRLGYPYYARTMYQMYRNLFAWLELQKKPVPIVLGLIIIVAVFNIVGTLLMIVLEKTKEIGILKSMGANSKSITKIFIYQGMFIGVVGTALGNALAYALCFIQLKYKPLSLPEDIYFMSSVPILLQAETFIIESLASLILCFLATLIPSIIASRIQPVEAIRFA